MIPRIIHQGVAGNPETDNVENYIYCYGSSTSGWTGLNNTATLFLLNGRLVFEKGGILVC